MPTPPNAAAWLVAEKATPLEIKEAPYTHPQAHELVIETHAVAINPVDWAIQAMGLFSFLKYPAILGQDLAGTVHAVGANVTHFKPGDRVVGYVFGVMSNTPSACAFQNYVVCHENCASKIPKDMSFESAAVLPLGLATAAAGLFHAEFLALQYPSTTPKKTGKTVLVWGGSTSVGCNAIQLAVAAGYEVITTASPGNHDYVKKLGATLVFDYKSSTVIPDIVAALKGKDFAGAYAIGSLTSAGNGAGAAQACIEIVAKTEGKKFVALSMQSEEKLPEGVEAKFVDKNGDMELLKMIFGDFLPKALAEGKFVVAPEPMVVGKGLGAIQEAFEVQKKGVSAKKVVVSL